MFLRKAAEGNTHDSSRATGRVLGGTIGRASVSSRHHSSRCQPKRSPARRYAELASKPAATGSKHIHSLLMSARYKDLNTINVSKS
jgi:hypothetical protein